MEKQIAFQRKNAVKMCGYVLQDEIEEIEAGALVWVKDEKDGSVFTFFPRLFPCQ